MYNRTHPYTSRILERSLLTGPSSTKITYHIVLDISQEPFPHKVGDSIGVIPMNDPQLVDQILHLTHLHGNEEWIDPRSMLPTTCKDYLLHKANLNRVNTTFFKLLSERGTPSELLFPDNKAKLTTYLESHALIDLLHHHPVTSFSPSDFGKLMPLMPRFYSIASSVKFYPNELHLTVAYVCYTAHGRTRYGVGSHFLCDMAAIDETPIPIYLQPSNHFTLPADPEASIILIGPGTGIAPFRAFMQERLATKAGGANWVFFGERNRVSDFYYSDFWLELEKQKRIQLDLAFSRDQEQKIYVQHKMLKRKKELWEWISRGSYIYVCGDAEEMAKDVDAALHKIVHEGGGYSEEDARQFLKKMRAEKRYLLDVY